MRQNGHAAAYMGRYDATHFNYERRPVKPALDGEPLYEDHPVSFNARQFCDSIASDVRSGAFLFAFSLAFQADAF
jgi:hypothetical protein